MIQDIMAEGGFVVDKPESALVHSIPCRSRTTNMTADKSTKRDLVLNFRKPKVGEFVITRLVDGRTFSEVARQVVRRLPYFSSGVPRRIRIYDDS